MFRPAPSCTDGVRNQNETGVDCGGVCGACSVHIAAKDLVIEGSWVIDGVDGTVDAVAQITNPNNLYGAQRISYAFVLHGEGDTIVAEKKGTTFALPAETKYIVEPGIEIPSEARVVRAEFRIDSAVDWVLFDGYQKPRIIVLNKRYELSSSSTEYSRVSGLVRNESPFDFARIWIKVVLRDATGTPLAIHRTHMDVMNSGDERAFSLPWPRKFSGEVASVDVETEVDVFQSETFRARYIGGAQ